LPAGFREGEREQQGATKHRERPRCRGAGGRQRRSAK
jgi:hypothetical protein